MNATRVINHICQWLTDYCNQANSQGFVIGISGGIDSAVTSTLTAKTGLPTLCLEMPIHQKAAQSDRARRHINQLEKKFSNVSSIQVNLTPVFDSLQDQLSDIQTAKKLLALANVRARLRMTTLYYYAGLQNYLVTGTGNKVEDIGVGFYTKYGDGGVDLSPIADLMKSQVYLLGKTLNVMEEIMHAPPTDGLWGDDRTDQDQLGANYEELEWAMRYEQHPHDVNLTQRQQQVLGIYRKLNRANEHKMNPVPICKIPKALIIM